ncbi:MAG: GNAT family N-acetyltransferase [Treponema sp.]|jgi:ribosomal protein S18 acetylase RimI-like enzyme|nr:GNAT family N-acetyltransferase [Treponema sp.]
MQFELTGALADAVLFSMEDQDALFVVDAKTGTVIRRDEAPEQEGPEEAGENRFIPLPRWDSSDGYRLMEHFAASFKNPLIRRELGEALGQGRGVFRAFKDVLASHPEAERRWFFFKTREMKREIQEWYNALREGWGLERIGHEPEETGDLVFEDFRFREAVEADAVPAAALHRLCIRDMEEYGGPRAPDWTFPGYLALTAETGGGDFAAYVSSVWKGDVLRICALEVLPEYRGLGLGEALLASFCEKLEDRAPVLTLDLPVQFEGFSRVLLRHNFKPRMIRYVLQRKTAEDRAGY